MSKMRDRLLLGVVSGLAGATAKNVVSEILMRNKVAEFGGPARAAGMLLPAHKVATPLGELVGWLADTAIASVLGVVSVYVLTLTGKDKAAVKGAIATGGIAWMGLYGVLGTMGATRVSSASAKTVLSEFLTHTVYGAVTGAVAAYLGEDGLFTGEIPITAATTKVAVLEPESQVVSEMRH